MRGESPAEAGPCKHKRLSEYIEQRKRHWVTAQWVYYELTPVPADWSVGWIGCSQHMDAPVASLNLEHVSPLGAGQPMEQPWLNHSTEPFGK